MYNDGGEGSGGNVKNVCHLPGQEFILSSPLHFMKGGGGVQSSPRAKWGALQEIYLGHKGNWSFLLWLEVYWYI